jgi:predicted permease
LISVLAGVVFGLAPALRSSRPDLNGVLKQTGRSLASAHPRAQAVFVIVEMALAMVLLVGAGLMIRTLARLWNVSPGFDTRGVIVFDITPSVSLSRQSPDAIHAAFREMESAVRAVPGVQNVSLESGAIPMEGDDEEPFFTDGMQRPEHAADLPLTLRYSVNSDYLKLMHLPLIRGRFITDADNEQAARVIVIDESFANRYFPGEDPVGKFVHFAPESIGGVRDDQIVGVVGHIKQFGLAPDSSNLVEAEIYEPFQQIPHTSLALVAEGGHIFVRTAEGVDPESVFPAIRHALTQRDGQMVVDELQPMQRIVADSIARQRFAMTMFSIFAGIALLLASIGIYGVLSYIVGQRTREVGIRMALGAQRAHVVGSVLRDGARMTLPGIAIGLLVSLAITRLMSTMLFGVTPTDLLTFASVPLVLCAVALLACYLPARRAAGLDPVRALRSE